MEGEELDERRQKASEIIKKLFRKRFQQNRQNLTPVQHRWINLINLHYQNQNKVLDSVIFKQIESLPENFDVASFFLPKIGMEMTRREKTGLNVSKMQNTTYSTYTAAFDPSSSTVSLSQQIKRKVKNKSQFVVIVKGFLFILFLAFMILTLQLWNNMHSDDYLIINTGFINQYKSFQRYVSMLKFLHASIDFIQNFVSSKENVFFN